MDYDFEMAKLQNKNWLIDEVQRALKESFREDNDDFLIQKAEKYANKKTRST